MRYYLDASALVKTLVPEEGAELMLRLADSTCERVASRLSFVGVGSALWRLVREVRIEAEAARRAVPALADPAPDYIRPLEFEPRVASRALELVQRYPLRAADAVHLASAVLAEADVFVSSDLRLLQSAQQEGLKCLDPTASPEADPTDG